MAQNHLIDPTYFYDAIEEFSFSYKLYVPIKNVIGEDGKSKISYNENWIRGSLQSQGKVLEQSLQGNKTTLSYNFYTKSIYRINIGDIMEYKNNYLLVDSVRDFDEFGCRSCTLKQITLEAYRDLAEFIRYKNGEMIV